MLGASKPLDSTRHAWCGSPLPAPSEPVPRLGSLPVQTNTMMMMPRSSAAAAAVLLCAWLQVATTRSSSGATTANVNRHPAPCPTRAGPGKMVVVLGDEGPYYSWEQCAYNHMLEFWNSWHAFLYYFYFFVQCASGRVLQYGHGSFVRCWMCVVVRATIASSYQSTASALCARVPAPTRAQYGS